MLPALRSKMQSASVTGNPSLLNDSLLCMSGSTSSRALHFVNVADALVLLTTASYCAFTQLCIRDPRPRLMNDWMSM